MIARAFFLSLVFATLFGVVVFGLTGQQRTTAAKWMLAVFACALFGLTVVLALTFLGGL